MSEKKTPIDEELLEELRENIKLTISSKEERKYAEEDRKNAFDDYDDYKKALTDSIKEQIKFKDKWRKNTLLALIILTGILFLNLIVLIYFPGVTWWGYTFPTTDKSIIIVFVSATFLNTFALLTLIFKYIFSPTDNLMQHNKDIE